MILKLMRFNGMSLMTFVAVPLKDYIDDDYDNDDGGA